MRIILDAHMIGEREGGNETYVTGLLEGFRGLRAQKPFSLSVLLGDNAKLLAGYPHYIQFQRLKSKNSLGRVFREIPQLCRSFNADVVHVTYNATPLLQCPLVVSVHDVSYRKYPRFFSPRVRFLLSTLLPITMAKARRLITMSESSKADIERYYPFTRGKISVIPGALGPITTAKPDYAASLLYAPDNDFILTVGTVQPRKNLKRLIQAYTDMRNRRVSNSKLLIVGRRSWHYAEVSRFAKASPFGRDIVFTGYLPDSVLAALYRRCRAFVFPSLYEGFGLPVLEAMACGAPVITSNSSSLPEVAGDAAMFIDPLSVTSISSAIDRVINDPERRNELQMRGTSQAARFSWKQTADLTLDVYYHALGASSSSQT